MEILGWVFLGLIAGALAKFVMPGRDPGGCVVTMLLGIAGALLAGFLGRVAGVYREGETAGFIAATIGAILILIAYRFLVRQK